jgi:hypothetical protein
LSFLSILLPVFVFFLFCPLYCLCLSFVFSVYCIACVCPLSFLSIVSPVFVLCLSLPLCCLCLWRYNGQKRLRTNRGHTMDKKTKDKHRQYNGQKRKRTNTGNTMDRKDK